MRQPTRPQQCTCGNSGTCGYCPSIALTATRETRMAAQRPGRRDDWTAEAAGTAAAARLASRRSR